MNYILDTWTTLPIEACKEETKVITLDHEVSYDSVKWAVVVVATSCQLSKVAASVG
jgi:hypothetical protein